MSQANLLRLDDERGQSILTCSNCGSEFKRQIGIIRRTLKRHPLQSTWFCSKQCNFYYRSRNKFCTILCYNCNKEFEDYKSKEKYKKSGKRYCTKECYLEATSSKIKKKCSLCHRIFIVHASKMKIHKGSRWYCSWSCYKNGVNGNQIKKCGMCKKEFKVYNSRIKSNKSATHFCSRKCYEKNRKALCVTKTCPNCKTTLEVPQYVLKENQRNWYCSWECYSRDKSRRIKTLNCKTCGKIIKRTFHKFKISSTGAFYCIDCFRRIRSIIRSGRNNPMFNKKYTINSHYYRKDLGHLCRSTWEANYCRILKHLGINYEYESHTFELPLGSYTPDLKINDKFIEIKGYPRIEYLLLLSQFKKYYPKITLILIEEKHYNSLKNHYKEMINWELPIRKK